jgi:hypothetical protein
VLVRDGLNELHGHDSDRGDDNEIEDETDDGYDGLSDGHVRGLLAGYALGTLDPDETELAARHISTCVACRTELAGYEATAGLLAFAAPVHQVPLRARAGLLAKMDEIGTVNSEQMIVLRPESPETPPQRATERTWLPKLTWQLPQWSRARVAAFSAVPLLLIAALVIAMGDRISDQQNQIDAIEQVQADTDRFVTGVGQDDPNAFQEVIPSSAARGAQGRLIIDRATDTALLLVVGLPQPREDEHYIVWLNFANNGEYAKAGPLTVEPDGRAKLILDPSGSIALYDGVLITAETAADVMSPTGPELMTAGIMPSE